ncbi:hypothetical protein SAMN04487981_11915 [Streptomyces sp. cf386]|nr:hypothetical protein SAMN04487981_11915 [Streptomyces sp. cf386]
MASCTCSTWGAASPASTLRNDHGKKPPSSECHPGRLDHLQVLRPPPEAATYPRRARAVHGPCTACRPVPPCRLRPAAPPPVPAVRTHVCPGPTVLMSFGAGPVLRPPCRTTPSQCRVLGALLGSGPAGLGPQPAAGARPAPSQRHGCTVAVRSSSRLVARLRMPGLHRRHPPRDCAPLFRSWRGSVLGQKQTSWPCSGVLRPAGPPVRSRCPLSGGGRWKQLSRGAPGGRRRWWTRMY